MSAADTSVVVAAFASWHEGHSAARRALDRAVKIPAHVLLEAYSVLTRLPPPHRADPSLVVEFLRSRFPDVPLTLPAADCRDLVAEAASAGIEGGAIYDALIAATARAARATLLTRDRRAVPVYEALGASHRFVA